MKVCVALRNSIALVVALNFSAPSFAETNGQTPTVQSMSLEGGAVEQFDVAGLSLGMSPSQVTTVLALKGFTIKKGFWDEQSSWQSRLSQAVAERRPGTSVTKTMVPARTAAVGRQGETVEVVYVATQNGAKVSQVTYTMPSDRMSNEAFNAHVIAKYGKPGAVNPIWYYCEKKTSYCGGFTGTWSRFPHMSVFNNNIKLTYGENFKSSLDKIFSVAVETAAPRNGAATF